MQQTLLTVEDDSDLQNYLYDLLSEAGYNVLKTATGTSAIKVFEKIHPDLVLLDLILQDLKGTTVCAEMKKISPQTPVIFLTAHNDLSQILSSFDNGADDYIEKPFNTKELLARINARLVHTENSAKSLLQADDLELNNKTYKVTRGNELISLTPKEFKLLEFLLKNKNQVLSREQILSRVWKYQYDIESRVVDMYIGMLRNKIEIKNKKKLIYSMRGFGYVLRE